MGREPDNGQGVEEVDPLCGLASALGQSLDDPLRLSALEMTGLMDVRSDEVLDRLTSLASRLLSAPVALVSLVDDRRQHFASQVGLGSPVSEEAETPLSHSFCQHVVRGGTSLVVDDAVLDHRVRDNLAIEDLGVRSYAGFPLRDGDGNILGSFCVIDFAARKWSAEELRTVSDLAAVAASEIRNRLAAGAEARRMAMLAELTAALHSDLDVASAFRALAERLVPRLAHLCVMDVMGDDDTSWREAFVAASSPELQQMIQSSELLHRRRDNPNSAAHRALVTGSVVAVTEVDDRYLRRAARDADELAGYRAMGLGSLVAVPMRSHKRLEGVLSVARTTPSRPYDVNEIALLQEIAARMALAVANARTYEREHRTSVALQSALLPEIHPTPGLDVAVRYRPTARAVQVGGDWYDVLPLADQAFGLAVGDVAGHDMVAAAAMGQLRAVLRAYAWEGLGPAELLAQTCRLVRALDDSQTATIFYGRLDPPGEDGCRSLRYASAGHPPPVVVSRGETSMLTDGLSPLIGIPVASRAESSIVLAPGDALVLYTDGLVERRGASLTPALEHLQEIVAGSAGLGADGIAEAVLTAMAPPRDWDDDVALMVVKVTPLWLQDPPETMRSRPSQ